MNNKQVIDAFLCGHVGKSSNGNLRSLGDKLINYNTCIAERANGRIIVNTTRYSVSTSKIQCWTLGAITILVGDNFAKVDDVPMNTASLSRFIK